MKTKIIFAALPLCCLPQNCFAQPLKVFILAGQSNMQGHASITTFDSLADDPKTAPLLAEMRGPDGQQRVCKRVWISSVGCLGDAYSDLTEAKGKLSAGFGAPEDKIGPEFTFGLTMEQENETARESYLRLGFSETGYVVFERLFPRSDKTRP